MEQKKHEQYLNLEDYLNLEQETDQRYEYHNGQVFAMAGGSPKHNAICQNIQRILGNKLLHQNCNIFTSDQKISIEEMNKFLYPDASVVCGPLKVSQKDKYAIINPILLVEVLSQSTAPYDQGQKMAYYQNISALREYVIVYQQMPGAQVFYRSSGSDLWKIRWIGDLNQSVQLESLDIVLELKELYFKTENLPGEE